MVPVLLAACNSQDRDEGGGTSAASCVAPYVDDQRPDETSATAPPTLRPGDSITLYGHFYTETCNDTGGEDPLVPMDPVHLTATLPGGDEVDLGTFTPSGDDMGFTTTLVVPASTPDGNVRVSDGLGHPYSFVVRH